MMFRRQLPLFSIAILTASAIPSVANAKTSDTQRISIDLAATATLNNTTLEPGEYTVVVEGNQAKFERDGKTVAEVPCTWKTLSAKASNTEILTNQSQIKEIDISGKAQAIEFSSN